MQGDHRFHATLPQCLEDVGIVAELAGGELPRPRFDPAPLDRQPVGVLMQAFQQIKVFPEPPIVIARRVRGVAILDMPGDLFPGPPVVGMVAAFDLVSGRGRSPEKVLRERHGAGVCWARIVRITARITRAIARTTTAPTGPMTAAIALSVEMP